MELHALTALLRGSVALLYSLPNPILYTHTHSDRGCINNRIDITQTFAHNVYTSTLASLKTAAIILLLYTEVQPVQSPVYTYTRTV